MRSVNVTETREQLAKLLDADALDRLRNRG